MTCALYRHFDADGQLLYVGVTSNPKRRLAEHKSRAVWSDQISRVDVKWMRSREAALEAEAKAIADELPVFNGGGHQPYVKTGDALRDWMNEAGLKQRHLAEASGISTSTISQMINGQRRAPLRFAVMVEDWSEGKVPCRYWMFGATAEPHGSEGKVLRLVTTPEASA